MKDNLQDLGRQLAENKLLSPGVTVSARMHIRGFGHAPMTVEKSGTILSADTIGIKGLFDGKQRYARYEDIVAIEGMDLPRFAQAYRIKTATKKKKR